MVMPNIIVNTAGGMSPKQYSIDPRDIEHELECPVITARLVVSSLG